MRPGPFFIATGEPSGDAYGGLLARALRRADPRRRVEGFGGERMRAAGAATDDRLLRGAVMGWTGVVRHLALYASLLRGLQRRWRSRPPAALVCVDFPGFNLRLARLAHGLGVPVYYYVCPQVWAWGAGRLMVMRRLLRRVYPVLPFEPPLYEAFGIPATFPGHPIREILPRRAPARGPALKAAGLDPARPVAVVLPGSRDEEIRLHWPVFAGAIRRLGPAARRFQWAVVATSHTAPLLAARAAEAGTDATVRVVRDPGYAVRAQAAFAWTSSGTSTLELGLLGVPQAVVYRGNPLNWAIARALVRVPWISLVNLILRRGAVPEYLQERATPEAVAAATRRTLWSGRARARREAAELAAALGDGRASATVARDLLADLAAPGRP